MQYNSAIVDRIKNFSKNWNMQLWPVCLQPDLL